MLKKFISVIVCVVMVAAMFAGCASRKPKTFKEAAEAGESFFKSEGVKDVKLTIGYQDTNAVIEGQYDHVNARGVFSIKLDLKDTEHTFKDMFVLNGNNLYIKVPDMSVLEGMFAGMNGIVAEDDTIGYEYSGENDDVIYDEDSAPEEEMFTKADVEQLLNMSDEELADLGMTRDMLNVFMKLFDEEGNFDYSKAADLSDEEFKLAFGIDKPDDEFPGYGDDMPDGDIGSMLPFLGLGELSDLNGKYITVKLPETKAETLRKVFEDAEAKAYEKLQKLDAEKDYPYVVKVTKADAKDLIVSVMDGLKAGKSSIAGELAAIITEYLGTDLVKMIEEGSEEKQTLKDAVEAGLDEMFANTNPDDIDLGEEDDFDCVMRSAYESGKKYELVSDVSAGKGEEKETFKVTLTVTKAETTDGFADKCAAPAADAVDILKNIKDALSELMKAAEVNA